MSRVYASLIISALTVAALPTTASARCYGCYAPPQPCGTCYQPQVIPPQYRTVMVPQTAMVAPQYAVRERVEMVAPARTYYAPVVPRCGSCGY
jgi:putative hemolysin